MSSNVRKVYTALADREATRIAYANTRHPRAPEEVYYSIARSLNTRKANRYSNIHAYDRTAIDVNGAYLNASLVQLGKQWWIASQAPVPSSFDTFLQALQEGSASKQHGVETRGIVIVQLTAWTEGGIQKAHTYLDLLQLRVSEYRHDISCTISAGTAKGRPITHYAFDLWPDHGVPEGDAEKALMGLIDEVHHKAVGREVWVHCSAGVGRTGTFIALSYLRHAEGEILVSGSLLGPLPTDLQSDAVACCVDALREARMCMVQSESQLELIYNNV